MNTSNTRSVITNTQLNWVRMFWLFLGLVSFLCALGIFTESQLYAYTIGIHGTYAHIIYYVVGVTFSSAIQVLLIKPDFCKALIPERGWRTYLKPLGRYLYMFTTCFLSSGTLLRYLGLSSDRTSSSPVVAVAPYRSKAFSEIAGLLASALLTVNALSIIILLRPAEHNAFFEVAATLTMESALALLYKHPYITVAAAVFVLAITLLKYLLCIAAGQQPAGGRAAGQPPAGGRAARQQPAGGRAARQPPAGGRAAGQQPAGGRAAGQLPAGGRAAGQQPAGGRAAGQPPAGGRAAGQQPAGGRAAGQLPAGGRAAGQQPAGGRLLA